MEAINAPLRRLVALLLAPFADQPVWVGVAVVTVLVTLVAMPVIKYTFNLRWADVAKRRLAASVLELRLLNDDLRAVFRALVDMLRWTGGYLGAWLLPLVVLGVVMLPVFAQLQSHWGWTGLAPGETTVLRARLASDRDTRPDARLTAGAGAIVETPTLWIAARRELAWRVRGETPGLHVLTLEVDGETYVKELVVADGPARRSPVKPGGFAGQLLYPGEPPLPPGPVAEMTLDYPESATFALVPVWCWILVLLSIPIALLLKKPFGVEF